MAPPRTRVKICGVTRVEDALAAAEAGADAVGFVFYAKSPRAVSPEVAREIALALPPFMSRVGLFVDAPSETVAAVLQQVPLDLLQFHGSESPAYCGRFGRPYLKAVPMAEGTDPVAYMDAYPEAAGFLLDSHGNGRVGGTGETFDWGRIPRDLRHCLVLAGGLNPDNVAEAVRRVRPWAVDVSSGVEARPAIKDPERIRAFVDEVRRVDCNP
ncbi:N-(5'-phosphoribosyl)anthranilate isomerase [Thioalkalivibrio denitrificans]|uniref:N-(5'-phosphoribosyl)anthranilate isomerase n=1 Tax=Thioalkalivibrio denitrificans TaxID=108003 RepID=A0A1V3NBV4_9GAMM|nr:phosphoribosylanthranilate isomerase [Thioalkalivibrio denitrificans]OOG22332.1 N-(5'-phosphoribosyl)anthranilate isomerase [Thioalkalivibrio denitrificans]